MKEYKYVDTDSVNKENNSLEKALIKNILNSKYGFKVKECNETERKFNKIMDILEFIYNRHHGAYEISFILYEVIKIIYYIEKCDETSATKCFTTINQIKNMINRSDLL